MLAFMVDAYDEEIVADRERTVLRLHPQIAPVKVAVLPLIPRNAEIGGRARALYEELRRSVVAEYDDSGQIGRRYPRQDEIGTPYASRSTSRRWRTTPPRFATATRWSRNGSRSRVRALRP